MTQQIKLGHSFHNDLVRDLKKVTYNKQGQGLQAMEHQLNRQGVVPREDTSVPENLEQFINSCRSPQARKAKKSLLILSPTESSRKDLIGKNNKVLDFKDYLSRECSPNSRMPGFM